MQRVNAQYHSNLLLNDVQAAISKKRPGKLPKGIILLHKNTRLHKENLITATLATLGWEIFNHFPYSLDSAPSDYHLFGPMKDHLGGQKFKTDDELKHSVLNWLCSEPTSLHAASISTLPW
jgi:hypothetical protein